jgi:hypothetical protein
MSTAQAIQIVWASVTALVFVEAARHAWTKLKIKTLAVMCWVLAIALQAALTHKALGPEGVARLAALFGF